MEPTTKRFSRSIMFGISGQTRSIVSRVKSTFLVEFLIASEIAMAVAEFLERSPIKIEKSAASTYSVMALDLAKEPDSVLLKKLTPGIGGILPRRASGSRMPNDFTGNVLEIKSAVLATTAKLLEFPPIILIWPVFCSGMFHSRSW